MIMSCMVTNPYKTNFIETCCELCDSFQEEVFPEFIIIINIINILGKYIAT